MGFFQTAVSKAHNRQAGQGAYFQKRFSMKSYLGISTGAILAFLALTINIQNTPPLWWDEGWTLSVARNWVEQGHYGRLLAGKAAPPGLEATFPVSFPVSFTFQLFGVGVWQGRLAILSYMLGTLAVVFYLARRLYNQPIAVATVLVLFFMLPQIEIHPIMVGRQVLGEMPAMFYLLTGYAFFLLALEGQLWLLPVVVAVWGIALITKAQVMPFWAASLIVPLAIALWSKNWRRSSLFAISFICSVMLYAMLLWLWRRFLQQTFPQSPLLGMYQVTALVGAIPSRAIALFVVFAYGLPTLLGLCYGVLSFIRSKEKFAPGSHAEVIRLSLLVLAGSWFAWYVTLSVGWARYVFPATFIGSIFVAAMLYQLTNHFNVSWTLGNAGSVLRNLGSSRQGIGALIAILLIVNAFPRTLRMLYDSYVMKADASALEVVEFLNTRTLPDSIIETYDSELFFLLERPYHYPPDQIHVELNRRYFLSQDVSIDYDPLAVDPDYLVVGPHSKLWKLYDRAVQSGSFRLVQAYGRYDVYERVR
jgi:hypothetical protein